MFPDIGFKCRAGFSLESRVAGGAIAARRVPVGAYQVIINACQKSFDDPRVRRAVHLALHRLREAERAWNELAPAAAEA